MSSPWFVVIATILIISASAFFVAIEFALMAAKRHRLEDAALTSRSARAALRSSSELTLLLAGSQLGITVCTLALGALTKPAVHYWLTPIFIDLGLPAVFADILGFILALFIVTFLHLVVGEMAPKSWAISHPEKSATMLAIPMRGFMWVFRPLLRALNSSANALLRKVGVEPTDEITNQQNVKELQQLVDHSIQVGALDAQYASRITGALEMQTMTVGEIASTGTPLTAVPQDANVHDVQAASRLTGHLRILVGDGKRITGVVHVRDTLLGTADDPIELYTRPVFTLDGATTLHTALATMRRTRTHLAVITVGGRPNGVITLADVLQRLFPPEVPATAVAAV